MSQIYEDIIDDVAANEEEAAEAFLPQVNDRVDDAAQFDRFMFFMRRASAR